MAVHPRARIRASVVVALSFVSATAVAVPEKSTSPPIAESFKLPISPPLDQGDSDLCWVFATLSMLETNYMAKHAGAKVAFSRGALQRASIADRFQRLIEGTSAHLEDGGVAVDAIALIRAAGLVAAPDFHDYIDPDPLFAALPGRLPAAGLADKRKALDFALTRALGAAPRETRLDGRRLTAAQSAKAVLGDEQWTEYDVLGGGAAHVGPNTDPDARPGTEAHFVTLPTVIELIHRSLAHGEAIVWGRTDNHALLIFGADYDRDGHPVDYWIKDTFAPYVYRADAAVIHKTLTDVTVAVPPPDDERTAEKN